MKHRFPGKYAVFVWVGFTAGRSDEHTSELQAHGS